MILRPAALPLSCRAFDRGFIFAAIWADQAGPCDYAALEENLRACQATLLLFAELTRIDNINAPNRPWTGKPTTHRTGRRGPTQAGPRRSADRGKKPHDPVDIDPCDQGEALLDGFGPDRCAGRRPQTTRRRELRMTVFCTVARTRCLEPRRPWIDGLGLR